MSIESQKGQQSNLSQTTETTQVPLSSNQADRELVGVLQLHAEQPVVTYAKEALGQVVIRRELRTEVIQVPVEIQTDVLIIERKPAGNTAPSTPVSGAHEAQAGQTANLREIMIDGKSLDVGERVELVLQAEQPVVQKQVVLVEEVDIYRQTHREQQHVQVDLRHEVLDWQQSGDLTQHVKRQADKPE